VQSTDPATFGLLSALFAVVSLLAGYFPARRAMGVDLLTAMRSE
jgi:ABC-type antimicrobial peptide transport system permease subunit